MYGGKLGRMYISSKPDETPASRGPPIAMYDTAKPTTSMPTEAAQMLAAAHVPTMTRTQLAMSANTYRRSRCRAVPAMLDSAPREIAAKQEYTAICGSPTRNRQV